MDQTPTWLYEHGYITFETYVNLVKERVSEYLAERGKR